MLRIRYFVATLLVPPFDTIKNVRAGQHERTAHAVRFLSLHTLQPLISLPNAF